MKFFVLKLDHQIRQGSPLMAASKMVPVPEALMSPDCPPIHVVHQNVLHTSSTSSSQNHKVSSAKSTKGLFRIAIQMKRILTKINTFLLI